jgi:uncharacterized membrane protein YfcA
LAPWLILFATVLFFVQSRLAARDGPTTAVPAVPRRPLGPWLAQLGVALYGGYFGAGIGILMLAILGGLGLRDIHAMNGLKNFFGICINGVAAAIFLFGGKVDYPSGALTLAGAVLGGYAGARFGRRIGQKRARAAVIGIGVALTVLLFVRDF